MTHRSGRYQPSAGWNTYTRPLLTGTKWVSSVLWPTGGLNPWNASNRVRSATGPYLGDIEPTIRNWYDFERNIKTAKALGYRWQCCAMYRPLDFLSRRIVRAGDLNLIDAHGSWHRYGDGSPPSVVGDKWLEHRLLLDPQLAIGEAYMNGRLSIERGRIYDLLALLASNVQQQPLPYWTAGF